MLICLDVDRHSHFTKRTMANNPVRDAVVTQL